MTNLHFGLLDEDRHFAALEMLSLRRLAEGELVQAFRLADRRCRISPMAEAHHYTLRGEISHLLGDLDAALADVKRALELAPDDLSANRRMMTWGSGEAQTDAARRLLTIDHDTTRIAAAIEVLRSTGMRAFAKIEWTDDLITGWIVWDRPQRATLVIDSEGEGEGEGEAISISLTTDPQHPLADSARYAASVMLKRPRSSGAQRVSVFAGKALLYAGHLPPNVHKVHWRLPLEKSALSRSAPSPGSTEPISIIIPVYGDFEATKACFDSLMPELEANPDARLIVVNDASEDQRIRDLLCAVSDHGHVRLLINEENLGFAESVNKGLAETGRGDVILLNADTVVPPGFIVRLQAAAHGAPGIGTLTPLSNNGEFTSFPVPYRSNPLLSYLEICNIDAATARVNANRVVDMPNGIGFCLYITRQCLDAVGNLAHIFRRGYFEDVDLCLRAREAGFRNVCATSVYVGHAGSRSFGTEKRALVVRNLATIEQRFPKYRAECAAFVEADPLHNAREAIERGLAGHNQGLTLLLSGPGPAKSTAQKRAHELETKGERVLLGVTRMTARGPEMKVTSPAKDMPQSIEFGLSSPSECGAALEFFDVARLSRIEIAEMAGLPAAMQDWVLRQKSPIDLLIADGGLFCPRDGFVRPDGSLCDAPHSRRLCDDCLFGLTDDDDSEPLKNWSATQDALLRTARHIYAPTSRAQSFASRFIPRRKFADIEGPAPPAERTTSPAMMMSAQSVGFVAVGTGIGEHRLMRETARTLNRELPERSIVVIGQTFDDLELMRLDNVHVTGSAEPEEYDRILRQYGIDALFIPVRPPLFGHPTVADLSARKPTAFFDWSFGDIPPGQEDLALNPYLSDAELAASLVSWLSNFSPNE